MKYKTILYIFKHLPFIRIRLECWVHDEMKDFCMLLLSMEVLFIKYITQVIYTVQGFFVPNGQTIFIIN